MASVPLLVSKKKGRPSSPSQAPAIVEMKIISHPRGKGIIQSNNTTTSLDGFVTFAPHFNREILPLTSGKWYYEVHLKTSGLMQIGWAVHGKFKPFGITQGVGDDEGSWAYDGYREKIWAAEDIDFPNSKWSMNATVGCALDRDEGVLTWYLNGEKLGWDFDIGDSLDASDGFFPCASLSHWPISQSLKWSFYEDEMQYIPEGYSAIPNTFRAADGYAPDTPGIMFSPGQKIAPASPVGAVRPSSSTMQFPSFRIQSHQYRSPSERTGGPSLEMKDALHLADEKDELLREFFRAASVSDTKQVSALVNEVDPDAVDIDAVYDGPTGSDTSFTAFHWASRRGLTEVGSILLSAGADINKQTRFGRTPLLLALENDHYDMVKWLIDQKADVTATDWMGRGALHYLCSSLAGIKSPTRAYHILESRIRMLHLLMKTGELDINAVDNDDRTPLMMACRHYLAVRATPKIEDYDSVLRSASHMDSLRGDSFQSFKEWTANPQGPQEVKTANLVEEFIKQGADPKFKNRTGWTCATEARTEFRRRRRNNRSERSQEQVLIYLKSIDVVDEEFQVERDENGYWLCPLCNATNKRNNNPHCDHCESPSPIKNPTGAIFIIIIRILRSGNNTLLRRFFTRNRISPNIRWPKYGMTTPFLLACQLDKPEAARILVEDLNANTLITNQHGQNGWMIAAASYAKGIVDWMLQAKLASVDEPGPEGRTALMLACQAHNVDAVRHLLLQCQADPNRCDLEQGATALFFAVYAGNVSVEIVEALIEAGSNVNHANHVGTTPLLALCQNRLFANKKEEEKEAFLSNTLAIAKALVRNGAVVDCVDKKGITPLLACVQSKRGTKLAQVARFLLKNHAKILQSKLQRTTALMVTVQDRDDELTQSILDSADSDSRDEMLSQLDEDHKSVLHHAVQANNLKMVKYLLDKGADASIRTEDGETVLHIACSSELPAQASVEDKEKEQEAQLAMVKFLIDKANVDPGLRNNRGRTAILNAIKRGALHVVKYLVKSAKVNIEDLTKRHDSALVIAALHHKWDIVCWLAAEGGASVSKQRQDGRTALMMAMETLAVRGAGEREIEIDDIRTMIINSSEYPTEYLTLSMDWIRTAFVTKKYRIAACLYGCRFTRIADGDHWDILRMIDLQDDDDVDALYKECREGVGKAPSPILACLRMVDVFSILAQLRPPLRRKIEAAQAAFRKLSLEIVNDLECNDFMASLILEQNVDTSKDCRQTLLDLALSTKNIEFLRSARVDRIINWWWESSASFEWSTLWKPRRLFRSPRIKFGLEIVSFLVFLGLFSTLLTERKAIQEGVSTLEWVLLFFGCGYFISELFQLVISGWTAYLEDGWNFFDISICVFSVTISVCRGVDWDESDRGSATVIYVSAMTLGAIVMWARALFLLTLPSDVFPLLLTVRKMMRDIYYFSALLLLILAGAFFAFTFLMADRNIESADLVDPLFPEDFAQYLSARNLFIFLFQHGLTGEPINDFGPLEETEQVLSQIVGSLYLLVTAVILVNLLIAMMNNTYARVKEQSQWEYLFTRTKTRWRYDQSYNGVPPPFNLVAIALFFAVYFLTRCGFAVRKFFTGSSGTYCSSCHTNMDENQPVVSLNYFERRNPGGSIAKKNFYLDQLIDIDAFTTVDLNFLWLRRQREAYESMVVKENGGEELTDEEFENHYSGNSKREYDEYEDDRARTADNEAFSVARYLGHTLHYGKDLDVKGFSNYGHLHTLSLIYADELAAKREMCMCGRLARPISPDRFVLELISFWIFAFFLYPFIVLAGIPALAIYDVLHRTQDRRKHAVPLRLRIMAAEKGEKGVRRSPREIAYEFFLEWKKPFWLRAFRIFNMGSKIERYSAADPLQHSKSVKLEKEEVSLSSQIDSLQDKIYNQIQQVHSQVEMLSSSVQKLDGRILLLENNHAPKDEDAAESADPDHKRSKSSS